MSKAPNDGSGKPAFAERLAARLAALRITQTAAAEKAGIAQTTLSGWVTGPAEPTASGLRRLADALECTTDYLVGRTSWPTVLPPSHWVIDLDREDMVRDRRSPPDHGRFAWPVPDRHEVVSSAKLEEREQQLFGKTTSKKEVRRGE